jgi:hypothetical protein
MDIDKHVPFVPVAQEKYNSLVSSVVFTYLQRARILFFLSYHFQYTMILCYNYESIQEMVRNWFYLSLNCIKKIFSCHWWLRKPLALLLLLHPKSSDSPMDYATRLTKRLNKYASIYKSQV